MKKIFLMLSYITLTFLTALMPIKSINASPKISFSDLLVQGELNPQSVRNARDAAIRQNLPLNILTKNKVMIDAKGIENSRIVYAVITDFANPYNGGFTAYSDEITGLYKISESKIDYGNGSIIDNTGGMYEPVATSSAAGDAFIMIPEWTGDQVYLFNAQTGDLVDAGFIPTTAPQLQSPKNALLHFSGKNILVSDQLSDVVQRFDTTGAYIGVFCPIGGPITSIVDNMRSITYRPNRNLLITVGSSANQNTVQQFDSGGVHLGTFCSTGLNSPFDVLMRSTDALVTNSSGTNKVTRYDLSGVFLSNFYAGGSFTFPEQINRLPNGLIVCAAFSPALTSGVAVLDSAGNFIKILQGVTGCRGVYLLGNGHYLTTNAAGVHEIDSATGTLIRTIQTAANFQYITPYNPGTVLSTGNELNSVPDKYTLYQNFPNPFNPSTNIKYQLPKSGFVKLTVFDAAGREVNTLVNSNQSAGTYEVTFDAGSLASGIYFYSFSVTGEAGDPSTSSGQRFKETMKMALIK